MHVGITKGMKLMSDTTPQADVKDRFTGSAPHSRRQKERLLSPADERDMNEA